MEAQWVRVYDYLRNAIAMGELAPGAQLPPEFEVSASQGVSRNTVRRAYLALSQDGRVGGYALLPGFTYAVTHNFEMRIIVIRRKSHFKKAELFQRFTRLYLSFPDKKSTLQMQSFNKRWWDEYFKTSLQCI